MTTYRQLMTGIKRASYTVPGHVPWSYCDDDDDIHNTGEKQDSKESLNVAVIHDPSGTYSGWLDYGSWALSAIAHMRSRWGVLPNGRRVLLPPDPPHFPDGARFYITPNKKNTQPARLVEIIAGDAVDLERRQRLEPVRSSGAVAWVDMP